MKRTTRGEAATAILIGVALAGVVLFGWKPKWLDRESRRAQASQQATTQLQEAAAAVDAAQEKRSSEAAASVTEIGRAASDAPASPQTEFIKREVPVALSKLPAPDAQALIEAAERRAAVEAGKYEVAARMYEQAMQRSDQLAERLTKAEAALVAANAKREAADRAISEAAAANLALERQRNQFIIVALVAGGLWLYVKMTRLSPGRLAEAVTDIRAGTDPVRALDNVTSPWEQAIVSRLAKLQAKP